MNVAVGIGVGLVTAGATYVALDHSMGAAPAERSSLDEALPYIVVGGAALGAIFLRTVGASATSAAVSNALLAGGAVGVLSALGKHAASPPQARWTPRDIALDYYEQYNDGPDDGELSFGEASRLEPGVGRYRTRYTNIARLVGEAAPINARSASIDDIERVVRSYDRDPSTEGLSEEEWRAFDRALGERDGLGLDPRAPTAPGRFPGRSVLAADPFRSRLLQVQDVPGVAPVPHEPFTNS